MKDIYLKAVYFSALPHYYKRSIKKLQESHTSNLSFNNTSSSTEHLITCYNYF